MSKIYLFVNEDDGRVTGWSSTQSNSQAEVDVPDDHEIRINPMIYTYVEGELIKDTDFQNDWIQRKAEKEQQPSDKELIAQLQEENQQLQDTVLQLTERVQLTEEATLAMIGGD